MQYLLFYIAFIIMAWPGMCCVVQVLIPVHFPRGGGGGFSAFSLLAEILLTACFCLTFVIVKEMLVLNKFKEAWLSVFVLPFYFVMSVDQCENICEHVFMFQQFFCGGLSIKNRKCITVSSHQSPSPSSPLSPVSRRPILPPRCHVCPLVRALRELTGRCRDERAGTRPRPHLVALANTGRCVPSRVVPYVVKGMEGSLCHRDSLCVYTCVHVCMHVCMCVYICVCNSLCVTLHPLRRYKHDIVNRSSTCWDQCWEPCWPVCSVCVSSLTTPRPGGLVGERRGWRGEERGKA